TEAIMEGMGGPRGGCRECATAMVREWERHENFQLYEDAIPALEQLRAHGLKVGLVSNGQRDLDEFVAHHRLQVDVAVGSLAHGRSACAPSWSTGTASMPASATGSTRCWRCRPRSACPSSECFSPGPSVPIRELSERCGWVGPRDGSIAHRAPCDGRRLVRARPRGGRPDRPPLRLLGLADPA